MNPEALAPQRAAIETGSLNTSTYYRLIALWALSEGVMGGIIHGFKLPVAGLIVGGAAVVIISLLGYYTGSRTAIIRATILVCIFKLMLSPQSPLPAYVAVLFQGVTGSLFFSTKKFYRISCILFAMLAMVEAASQRILVMTVLFGMSFWKAVNAFVSGLTGDKNLTNYSLYLAGAYLLAHALAGIAIGWFAGIIPSRIQVLSRDQRYRVPADALPAHADTDTVKKKKSHTWKWWLLVSWLLLLILFLQSQLHIGTPVLPSNAVLQIFIRSLLIIFAWYFIVSPMLLRLLKGWLLRKEQQSGSDMNEVLLLIPSTKALLVTCWKRSDAYRGVKRLKEFCKMVLVNSLHHFND